MAQTKKKRRRKHRGTQTGRIDTRPARGRPKNRAEAKARASSRGKGGKKRQPQQRGMVPPTWSGALKKGAIAGAIFFVLLAVAFKRPIPASLAVAVVMLGFYVPMAFLTDRFFYQRQQRKDEKERLAKAEQRSGQ